MLITDDFVMLNFPKTGSTFTRKVIKDLYGEGGTAEIFGVNPLNPDSVINSPHLSWSQIPSKYSSLPVVSIYRNIFDRYVSQYTFGWWRDHCSPEVKILAKSISPKFPEISFAEYIEVIERVIKPRIFALMGLPNTEKIGLQTLEFIIFYAKNPLHCLESAIANPLIDLRGYLPEIRFLRQSRLRLDLKEYLSYTPIARLAEEYIESAPDLNVSRPSSLVSWRQYWDDDRLNTCMMREQILLRHIGKLGLDAL